MGTIISVSIALNNELSLDDRDALEKFLRVRGDGLTNNLKNAVEAYMKKKGLNARVNLYGAVQVQRGK